MGTAIPGGTSRNVYVPQKEGWSLPMVPSRLPSFPQARLALRGEQDCL